MSGDERLIRYLDGELDPEARATVELALDADPVLQDRLARLRASGERTRAAYDAAIEEPVPDRLIAAVRGGQVLDFPRRRPGLNAAELWWSGAAIAASLLVGVFVGRTTGGTLVAADLSTRGALTTALNDQPSSYTGSRVRVALSFRSSEGPYCRAFSLAKEHTAGLACRTPRGWRVRMMTADGGSDRAGPYRMAGSALPPPLAQLAQSLASGPALDAKSERDAMTNKWR